MIVCVNQWPETSLHQGLTHRVLVTQVQPREGLSQGLLTLQQGGLLKGCERIEIAEVEWQLSGMPLWLRLSCSTFLEALMTCILSAMCKKDHVSLTQFRLLCCWPRFTETSLYRSEATDCEVYPGSVGCNMYMSLKQSLNKCTFVYGSKMQWVTNFNQIALPSKCQKVDLNM